MSMFQDMKTSCGGRWRIVSLVLVLVVPTLLIACQGSTSANGRFLAEVYRNDPGDPLVTQAGTSALVNAGHLVCSDYSADASAPGSKDAGGDLAALGFTGDWDDQTGAMPAIINSAIDNYCQNFEFLHG
jgi:hypothetical protein